MMILAGDIGGTKTLLAMARHDDLRHPLLERRYTNRTYTGPEDVLQAFLAETASFPGAPGKTEYACLGVAGPVLDNCASLTNLPWRLDGAALAHRFGIGQVRLVNDFAAAAAGIPLLHQDELAILQPGQPQPQACRLAIGAGTGLGVAILAAQDDGYKVIPGEGGHCGFAPSDEVQVDLWRALHDEVGRITMETIVSGPGLVRIYRYLRQRCAAVSATANAPLMTADPAAAIAHAAFTDNDPVAMRSIDLFLACFGAFAGDLALTVTARGGVYLCGGIAPKLLPALRRGGFLAAFKDKGPHRELAELMPVQVVLDDALGMHGAAWIAAETAAGRSPL